MKSTHILDNYEHVVRQIKAKQSDLDPVISDLVNDIAINNFILIPVKFSFDNDQPTYKIEAAIHSLHPMASEILEQNFLLSHAYEYLISAIESELKLTDERREYLWTKLADTVILYIKIDCEFLELSNNLKLIYYCQSTLKDENEIIRNTIKCKVSKCKTLKEVEQYIQKKHHSISIFLSNICVRIDPTNTDDLYSLSENFDRLDCLKIVFMMAEKLLCFLEQDYFKFLEPSAKASNDLISRIKHKLYLQISFITNNLEKSIVNDDLKQLVVRPLSKLNNHSFANRPSYSELKYSEKYCAHLSKLLQEKNVEVRESDIEKLMLYLNFNSFLYFKYYCDKVTLEMKSLTSYCDQLELLVQTLKNIKQQIDQPKFKYKSKLPGIKNQLINWLEEEIEYTMQKVNSRTDVAKHPAISAVSKLNSGLSVAELSYFCGLLVKSGIIENTNVTQVLRVVAENFKTSRSENISLKSIQSKYYNVEQSTSDGVRTKILELLKLTES